MSSGDLVVCPAGSYFERSTVTCRRPLRSQIVPRETSRQSFYRVPSIWSMFGLQRPSSGDRHRKFRIKLYRVISRTDPAENTADFEFEYSAGSDEDNRIEDRVQQDQIPGEDVHPWKVLLRWIEEDVDDDVRYPGEDERDEDGQHRDDQSEFTVHSLLTAAI